MIEVFFTTMSKIINSNFLLVLALVYFWVSACMDIYFVSSMDQKAQRMASLIYILHFFFLSIITLSVIGRIL